VVVLIVPDSRDEGYCADAAARDIDDASLHLPGHAGVDRAAPADQARRGDRSQPRQDPANAVTSRRFSSSGHLRRAAGARECGRSGRLTPAAEA